MEAKRTGKRRRRAIELLKQGNASLSDVRGKWSVKMSVSRWQQAYQESGSKPCVQRDSWAPSQLSSEENTVGAGAPCWSFGCRVSHGPLDTEADRRGNPKTLRYTYHPTMCGGYCGDDWSCQKPERRALQRNEQAIGHWNGPHGRI